MLLLSENLTTEERNRSAMAFKEKDKKVKKHTQM